MDRDELARLTAPSPWLRELHERWLRDDPAYREYCEWAEWVRSLPLPDCPAGAVRYRDE